VNAITASQDETRADSQLRHTVEEELAAEPSVDAAAIRVTAHDGIVTLTGFVASHAEKIKAEHAATRVFGVKAVAAELEVRLSDERKVADEAIARAAADALSWNSMIPAERIRLCVEGGWITLEGDVDWGYQRSTAYDSVAFLKGVRGVKNWITIKPRSISTAVKAHIEAALARRFGAHHRRHISVETRGDHVTLRGPVTSLTERQAVEQAAWTTPGVCHVNSNLWVTGPRI
jgi:osmotically-inducible protein OsmY